MGRLEPRIHSIFANPILFQWISHKILRLLTPFLLAAAMISAGALKCTSTGAREQGAEVFFWGLVIVIAVSGLAYWGGRRIRSRTLGLLGAFWGVNGALMLAAWDAWTGRFEARWKRGQTEERPET